MSRFACHVFVCTNLRAPENAKGCCAARGSVELAEALKLAANAAGLKGRVRVNKAGCLDACETGVSAVLYPQAVWYGHITLADVDEIVQRTLLRGEIVERLVVQPGRSPTAPRAGSSGPPAGGAT